MDSMDSMDSMDCRVTPFGLTRPTHVVVGSVGDLGEGVGGPEAASLVPASDIIALRFSARAGTERALVTIKIQRALIHAVAALPRPRLVIVIGGATLFALGVALAANSLAVAGECRVGVPNASWIDGQWSGIPVVTKSGGFGGPDLLVALVLAASYAAAATPLIMGIN